MTYSTSSYLTALRRDPGAARRHRNQDCAFVVSESEDAATALTTSKSNPQKLLRRTRRTRSQRQSSVASPPGVPPDVARLETSSRRLRSVQQEMPIQRPSTSTSQGHSRTLRTAIRPAPHPHVLCRCRPRYIPHDPLCRGPHRPSPFRYGTRPDSLVTSESSLWEPLRMVRRIKAIETLHAPTHRTEHSVSTDLPFISLRHQN